MSSFLSALRRAYYSATISTFARAEISDIFGELAREHQFDLQGTQREAWLESAKLLQSILRTHTGSIYLEFSIPRMGARIDAVVIIGPVIFVLEFKVGEKRFLRQDLDQVVDYALDLRNFHEGSHEAYIAPVLIATQARGSSQLPKSAPADRLFDVIQTNTEGLSGVINRVLELVDAPSLATDEWEKSRYKPTPTIIEATLALYRGHSVTEISRSDAGAINLAKTAGTVEEIIKRCRDKSEKAVCFVTGVPGAGKTLVGLNAATQHIDKKDELYSVFLSGNGPLVAILQEALARDHIKQARGKGNKVRKGDALRKSKAFIQNVHHFRDDCLADLNRGPVEHVAIFDEAQRAWNLKKTVDFMKRRKGVSGFQQSEPHFLISCLDRHPDWAVVICLVGGGQEINTGEAGIREWLIGLDQSFPEWKVYVSDRLTDREYAAESEINTLSDKKRIEFRSDLHLATSVRSFRSEKVSQLVKEVLDLDLDQVRRSLEEVNRNYPIVLTRNLESARRWLQTKARGSERYGIVVSSQAERLKPHALDVKTPVNPVHWFLNGKDDVRSSYYLEDVATEFHIQGLELDWACVVWDADFRHSSSGWDTWSFRGNRWQRIRAQERQMYLKNAYRVLLTRARQGMVIVVPEGAADDPTRKPEFYDPTYRYLREVGVRVI